MDAVLAEKLTVLLNAFEETDDPLKVDFEYDDEGAEIGVVSMRGVKAGVILFPDKTEKGQLFETKGVWVVEDCVPVVFARQGPGVKEMAVEECVVMMEALLKIKHDIVGNRMEE